VVWAALGCLALAALSLLLPTTPTYDPWAWILWGREILQGELVTTAGPSWKPLPVLVTTPLALLGDAAPDLWVLVARAGTLAGLAVAFVLARRLAGLAAAALAVVSLGLAAWVVRNGALGNSEGLLVLCVLGAVERQLAGARAQAFALGVGAGLLRPEAWPFIALHALWLVWEERGRLRWVVPGLLVLPLLWLVPERVGSGSFWRAAERAQEALPGTPAFAERPALAIVDRFENMLPDALWVGAGLALVLVALGRAPAGRGRDAALLAALAGAWVALVAAMTEAGFSGNERYLIAPAALACVLGAAGLAWTGRLLAARVPGPARPVRAAVLLAVGVVVVWSVAARALRDLPEPLADVRYQAALTDGLDDAVAQAGGERRLLRCAPLHTNKFFTQLVAWELGLHAVQVDYQPRAPAVVLRVRTLEGASPRPAGRLAGGRLLADTGLWRVEAACGSSLGTR
jgi:hypothetical protein